MNLLIGNLKLILVSSVFLVSSGETLAAEKIEFDSKSCPSYDREMPNIPRSQVYKDTPFKPGEEVRYELSYGAFGVHVGYGIMRVDKPLKHSVVSQNKDSQTSELRRWHRVFSVEAFTGDWYKAIFRAQDRLRAFSRPWDFGISHFYISEDHDKPFSARTYREKWLDFKHSDCTVFEREQVHHKNQEKKKTHALMPGSVDALGAVYRLRTFDFKNQKKTRFVVYTSGQNWWLDAKVIGFPEIETKIGKQKSVHLKVATSLGEDLEQKGAIDIWIATHHPQKPLLKVAGEAKFGEFALDIDRLTPGK